MDFTILIFLLAISAFLIWFPVKVRRNIVLYIGGFIVFYLSRTFGLLDDQSSTAGIVKSDYQRPHVLFFFFV